MGKISIVELRRSWKQEDLNEIIDLENTIKKFKSFAKKWKRLNSEGMVIAIQGCVEVFERCLQELKERYIESWCIK